MVSDIVFHSEDIHVFIILLCTPLSLEIVEIGDNADEDS